MTTIHITNEIIEQVQRLLGEQAAGCRPGAPGEAMLPVRRSALFPTVQQLHLEGAAVLDVTAVVRSGAPVLLVTLAVRRGLLTLETELPPDDASFPSLTRIQPAVHWLERELWDLMSVHPTGHPLLETIVFPMGQLPACAPLRPDVAFHPHRAHPPQPRVAGEGLFFIPFGPIRSGVVESAQIRVETNGEDMLLVEPQVFFKHRGMERRFTETPLPLTVLLAERVAGVMSCAYSLAYCQAVERALGVEVSARARLLRTVFAELERCFNHFDAIMKLCDDASLAVAVAQFAILKERVLRLGAAVTGSRYLRGSIVLGGVGCDITKDHVAAIERELDAIERLFDTNAAILTRTESFTDRLIGTGRLSHEDAVAFGACGPVARGSGLSADTRADRPYAAYDFVTFEPVLREAGDAMARFEVRLREITASLFMIRQALDLLEPGSLAAPLPDAPAGARAHGWAEAPDGEVLVYVEFGPDGGMARCHIRPAALLNWGLFHRTTARNVLTDYAFIEHSFGLTQAGCDR
jgi:formate hydrogenlyase subunit 5